MDEAVDAILPGFTVDIDHNPYLPTGGRHVSAVVTVTADAPEDTPPRPPGAGRAEIIIVDRSGSMAMPPGKIAAARAATAAAVDVIGDGVWFAIISGARSARPVYPAKGMAVADERTRQAAKEAVLRLQARGGTAIEPLAAAGVPSSSSPARPRCGTPSCSLTA